MLLIDMKAIIFDFNVVKKYTCKHVMKCFMLNALFNCCDVDQVYQQSKIL
jgi:hypothetical protein